MRAAEKIEAEASRWLAVRDARPPTPEDDAAFDRWIDADIRHRVAYLRLESAWRRADRLHELQPLDRRVDADLLRAHGRRRRWPLAMAASVVLALVVGSVFFARASFGWEHYEDLARLAGETPFGLCDIAVIERRPP